MARVLPFNGTLQFYLGFLPENNRAATTHCERAAPFSPFRLSPGRARGLAHHLPNGHCRFAALAKPLPLPLLACRPDATSRQTATDRATGVNAPSPPPLAGPQAGPPQTRPDVHAGLGAIQGL